LKQEEGKERRKFHEDDFVFCEGILFEKKQIIALAQKVFFFKQGWKFWRIRLPLRSRRDSIAS
jgi:hypothetical protein